jgi:hypothetical protein
MERRADMLLSTMSSYVEAMGGKLRLVAEFPNRRPYTVKLGDLSEAAQTGQPSPALLRHKGRYAVVIGGDFCYALPKGKGTDGSNDGRHFCHNNSDC